ncbi:MAG: ceramidase domain-containing protein [Pseudomonadota bacterium]
MDWSRQIDGYCERLGPEFWAEPWNAITNAAFIIAALVCLVIAMRRGRLDGPVSWLIFLITAIGVGSFLFHSYATVWAAIADVLPIGLFILSYFTISMRCYGGYGWGLSLGLTVGYVVALFAVSSVVNLLLRDLIGGSVSYVPAFLALLAVGGWLMGRDHPAGWWLIGAGLVFAVSIGFRTVDIPLCENYATGTHWLWHILNGVVLGSLVIGLIRHGRRPEPKEVF